MSPTAMSLLATKNAAVVFTCSKEATAQEAAKLMSMRRIGSLVVTDGTQTVQGIFTERDVMMRVVAEGRDAARTRVGEVMTTEVITVSPDTSIEDVESIMRQHRVRHLPVVGDRGLLGLVSIGDVLVHHAESRKQMVEQLTDYVSGSYR
jgi:CBS domain-containing protein